DLYGLDPRHPDGKAMAASLWGRSHIPVRAFESIGVMSERGDSHLFHLMVLSLPIGPPYSPDSTSPLRLSSLPQQFQLRRSARLRRSGTTQRTLATQWSRSQLQVALQSTPSPEPYCISLMYD